MADLGQVRSSDVLQSEKHKNDHELFLEAYEKPTQIYRFLKARHSIEPIFLHRNLSYMKERSSRKRMKKRKKEVKIDELSTKTIDSKDLSVQIKSDNQLQITFQSLKIEENLDSSPCEDQDKVNEPAICGNDCPMQVEVLLYRFRQPSPEILLTNPSSLPCDCTTLGKCLIPNSNSPNCSVPDKHTITIPGSVLSWKGTGGVLGTHMLAFRVTPIDEPKSLDSHQKRKTRKRCHSQNDGSGVDFEAHNGEVFPTINGLLHERLNTSDQQFSQDQIITENGQWHKRDNNVSYVSTSSRLHKKAPGGKTLPTLGTSYNELLISIPRESLDSFSNNSSDHAKNKRLRRTELQLLIDGDKPKHQHNHLEATPPILPETRSAHSISMNKSYDSRKRILSDSSLLQPKKETDRQLSEMMTRDPCIPPPHKRSHIVTSEPTAFSVSSTKTSLVSSFLHSSSPLPQNVQIYHAELVAFDSREECLLLDGEYDLNMKKCSQDESSSEYSMNGLKKLKWDSLLSNNYLEKSFEKKESKVVSLKFTVEWLYGPPKARVKDFNSTSLDFVKLRKEYEEMVSSLSSIDSPQALPNLMSTPEKSHAPHKYTPSDIKPTVFNFLYNKNTLQQTELKFQFVCPWCSLHCEKLYSLLKHMTLCHPRFQFTYSPIEGGANIDVRLNRMYECETTSPDPAERVRRDGLKRKQQPTRCKPYTALLVNKVDTTSDEDLSEFTVGKQFARPKLSRVFYHTHSCLPMLPEERDSEVDDIPDWLKMTSMRMVDEFIDVNDGEKQFMKIWNLFMMENKTLADKQVPQVCLLFAQQKKDDLAKKRLLHNFISHLIYMCDIGLVTPSTLTEVTRFLYNDNPSKI